MAYIEVQAAPKHRLIVGNTEVTTTSIYLTTAELRALRDKIDDILGGE